MPEEVLFAFERRTDAAEIAASLRAVADNLEAGEAITLEAGGDSVTMSPPSRPTFEVKAERETSSSGGPAELSVEFELEWTEGESDDGTGDGSLTVE
ncbi:amphi-Trp domain-containing protein [Salinilacihabitans rarus]|uniref:amphi-Trp domain-containing protein n=1 Tax=Salinilacihabitans rarus TaxID=2961596 RepID=UPI0020C8FC79|nr:amphi-Trp domain-containing protein [Salinilacihabitans rarus]